MAVKAASYLQTNVGSRKRPLAYVGGWLGKDNLGDQALFDAARSLFPEFGLWHYDGSRTLSTLLQAISRTSSGLFAGGTLINRTPEYLDLAQRFAASGKSLHIFGTGVADPCFWTGRGDFRNMLAEWKPLLERCGPIGVRGPRSAQLLREAGLSQVNVVGDPVLTFAGETLPPPVHDRSLGLNIGFDHGNQWGDAQRLQQQMLALAQQATKAGWRVRWYVVFPKDLPLTRELAAASNTADDIFTTYDRPHDYIRDVSSMSLFVGMKLHATMLALCGYVPSLMLEYDPKCADFMHSIDQGSALIRTDRFEANEAWELLQQWHPTRQPRSQALYNSVQSLRRTQLAFARELARAMISRN